MLHLTPWKQKTDKVVKDYSGKLKDEFQTLFDRFVNCWMEPVDVESGFRHEFGALEFEDHDDEFVVHLDVPGYEAKELEVLASENLLTIKAAKKTTPQKVTTQKGTSQKRGSHKDANGNHEEQSYRTLHRTVSLPNGIDVEGITANYRHGMLDIHLPKRDELKPKRIPVNSPTSKS